MSDEPTTDDVLRLRPVAAVGGRWGRLARRLGFTPVAGSGWLGRRRKLLVGERDGYLVTVSPAHTVNASSVDVLVRFPQGHTVLGFSDDLRGKVRRRRRRHLHVGDGTVLQRLPYAVVPPTAGAVDRSTTEVIGAMRDLVRPLERLCEACGGAHDLGLYLADGVPFVSCAGCVDAYRRGERDLGSSVERLAPDLAAGARIGLVAAVALGIALGALASLAVVYAGTWAAVAAAPAFFALGFLTCAFASRELGGASIASTLMKLPLALAGVPIATTVMTAVGKMTLQPAEWNLTFLLSSLVGPLRATPRAVALLAAASAAGWLVEALVRALGGGRRRVRRVRIERIERDVIPTEAP